MKKYCFFIVVLIFLSGCSIKNHLASSFNKRKYTKGYFWDNSGKIPTVAVKPYSYGTKVNTLINKKDNNEIKTGCNKTEVKEIESKIGLLIGNAPRINNKLSVQPRVPDIVNTVEWVYEKEQINDKTNNSPNNVWAIIGSVLLILSLALFFIGLFLFGASISGVLISLSDIVYLAAIIILLASNKNKQTKSKFGDWGILSFITSIFDILVFLALPKYKLYFLSLHLPVPFPNYAIFLLGFYLLLADYYAIRALFQKDNKQKGLAVAAIAITIVVFILFLLFPKL